MRLVFIVSDNPDMWPQLWPKSKTIPEGWQKVDLYGANGGKIPIELDIGDTIQVQNMEMD